MLESDTHRRNIVLLLHRETIMWWLWLLFLYNNLLWYYFLLRYFLFSPLSMNGYRPIIFNLLNLSVLVVRDLLMTAYIPLFEHRFDHRVILFFDFFV